MVKNCRESLKKNLQPLRRLNTALNPVLVEVRPLGWSPLREKLRQPY
jgi:hypothetical protein